MTPRSAMVFAAGFGTRMMPLTADRPKPLVSVAGRPLIDHALDLVTKAGLAAVVNLHYRADQLAAHLQGRAGVTVTRESPDILETGGGLKAALPLLGPGPVATLNTDMVWRGTNPLTQLLQHWDPDRMEALLLLVPASRAISHPKGGDFAMDGDGALRRDSASGLVYTGAQIINPDAVAQIEDTAFSLNTVWDGMIDRRGLFGVVYDGHWADVGTPGAIAPAEAMLAGA